MRHWVQCGPDSDLHNSEADTIKKVVCEEMIAWGLVDRTDVAVMTQMVSRAVGIGEPADVVVSANLYERQAVSMRLRRIKAGITLGARTST